MADTAVETRLPETGLRITLKIGHIPIPDLLRDLMPRHAGRGVTKNVAAFAEKIVLGPPREINLWIGGVRTFYAGFSLPGTPHVPHKSFDGWEPYGDIPHPPEDMDLGRSSSLVGEKAGRVPIYRQLLSFGMAHAPAETGLYLAKEYPRGLGDTRIAFPRGPIPKLTDVKREKFKDLLWQSGDMLRFGPNTNRGLVVANRGEEETQEVKQRRLIEQRREVAMKDEDWWLGVMPANAVSFDSSTQLALMY